VLLDAGNGWNTGEGKDIGDPAHHEYPFWDPNRRLHEGGANYPFTDGHVEYLPSPAVTGAYLDGDFTP